MFADTATVFALSVLYRVLNCLCIQTAFVPDEYWQSLEPAHKLVFAEGYLTWEWRRGIRSYVYPLLFAVYYKLLAVCGLDMNYWLLTTGPRMLQSLLFGVTTDVYLYRLAMRLGGPNVARCSLAAYWINWFQFFATPRTLTNGVETAALVMGLYYYAWPQQYTYASATCTSHRPFLALATLSTVIRPTCAVFWAPLAMWVLFRQTYTNVQYVQREHAGQPLFQLFSRILPLAIDWSFVREAFTVCVPLLLSCVLVDRFAYGHWLFSMYRFLEFNVLEGGSAHFGSHPVWWYVLSGVPGVMFTHSYMLCLFYVYRHIYTHKRAAVRFLVYLCVLYVAVFSLLAHKEHRFLLPLVPICAIFVGCWFEIGVEGVWPVTLWRSRVFGLLLLLCTNGALAVFTGVYHQRAPLTTTRHLHHELWRAHASGAGALHVLMAMPCHSTPLYSHIHPPAHTKLEHLTCEPNLLHRANYTDEADRFFAAPAKFLRRRWSSGQNVPDYVLAYETLWKDNEQVRQLLTEHGFQPKHSFFHTYFPDGNRQSNFVLLLHRNHTLVSV